MPKKSASTISTMDAARISSAARRTCRGDRNETETMMPSVGSRNAAWRSTK